MTLLPAVPAHKGNTAAKRRALALIVIRGAQLMLQMDFLIVMGRFGMIAY